MAESRKSNPQLIEDNQRLRAVVAQLEDRLDHLSEHGVTAKVLQFSEALNRDVMSAVSETVLIADEAGKLTYVSPNAHLIFGHAAADIMKQGRVCFVLPNDLFDADMLEQRGEITNISCQIRDSVGRGRNLLVNVRRVETQNGKILYVCRDVTERIKIELEHELLSLTLERRVDEQTRDLRTSRDRYRRLVEGLRDEYFFYAADLDGVITYVSPSLLSILGRTPAEAIGHNWREFVNTHESSLEYLENIHKLRRSGLPTPPYTAPIPHVNGEIRILEFHDSTLLDSDGRIIAIEGIGKDVTLRHLAEESLRRSQQDLEQRVEARTAELTAKNEQLRQSQERYLSVIQDHLEFIIRWHDDGIRTFVNDSYCEHCQIQSEELIGTSFMATVVADDVEELRRKLATVTAANPVVVHEHRATKPTGQTVWEHWTHRALFNPGGKLIEFQSVGCDVTERHWREERAQVWAQASDKLRTLTDREYDVMRLVVAGDANKVVARKLNLSIKTIEKHRSSLMKKLHVRSVPELVRLALLIENTWPL
jgi:PAS domain S-box-containing protein